ncbi:hypothetical protein DRQ00_09735 [candidate division KSB1 bacterium]|nr:MAG: hypothetical protein DRQ00_09735 [candidate division KSB1 bacterium]
MSKNISFYLGTILNFNCNISSDFFRKPYLTHVQKIEKSLAKFSESGIKELIEKSNLKYYHGKKS